MKEEIKSIQYYEFTGLSEAQNKALPGLLRGYGYQPIEDDPDLFIRRMGVTNGYLTRVIKDHLVWASTHWVLEYNGPERLFEAFRNSSYNPDSVRELITAKA